MSPGAVMGGSGAIRTLNAHDHGRGATPRVRGICNLELRIGWMRARVMCNQMLREVRLVEYGSIDREIWIDAAPEIVFDVVSNPVHVQEWWPDEAHYEAVPGSPGQLWFDKQAGEEHRVGIQVVDAIPYRLFSFRWTHPVGEAAREDNSFLVTFRLEPQGGGTLLRMSETGFRELGWEAAVLEETYRDHVQGWDYHLARLAPYVARYLAGTR